MALAKYGSSVIKLGLGDKVTVGDSIIFQTPVGTFIDRPSGMMGQRRTVEPFPLPATIGTDVVNDGQTRRVTITFVPL